MKLGTPKKARDNGLVAGRAASPVTCLTNAIPNPHQAFHASPVGDIQAFMPLSHFGSRKAAEDRAQRFLREGKEIRVYEVQLDIKNPLRIHDLPKSTSYSAVHSPFRIGEMLYYDVKPRLITDDERVILLGAKDDQERTDKLVQILRSKGYDGLVYENRWEDPGSLSWVILDPAQALIQES